MTPANGGATIQYNASRTTPAIVAIGLGLMLGVLARTATIAGVVLLALYWIVAPPFAGVTYAMPAEGSYVLVNKVLVELGALLVVWAFPTSHVFGLDRYLVWRRTAKPAAPEADGLREVV